MCLMTGINRNFLSIAFRRRRRCHDLRLYRFDWFFRPCHLSEVGICQKKIRHSVFFSHSDTFILQFFHKRLIIILILFQVQKNRCHIFFLIRSDLSILCRIPEICCHRFYIVIFHCLFNRSDQILFLYDRIRRIFRRFRCHRLCRRYRNFFCLLLCLLHLFHLLSGFSISQDGCKTQSEHDDHDDHDRQIHSVS